MLINHGAIYLDYFCWVYFYRKNDLELRCFFYQKEEYESDRHLSHVFIRREIFGKAIAFC